MPLEPGASTLANMSAPPRSTVLLPRLQADTPVGVTESPDGSARGLRDVPVGPGGGRLLSHAICLARVELPTAVCARLRMGHGAPQLARPLGLARALVAIGRLADAADPPRVRRGAVGSELSRVSEMPEGDLLQELTARIETVEWPQWVPRVGMVTPLGIDIAVAANPMRTPGSPCGIACPLLAARVVSAIRGPVFVRDAAPSLVHLLEFHGSQTPSGAWELWLPIRPGTVRPAMSAAPAANDVTNP